jgi:hypothetical protein
VKEEEGEGKEVEGRRWRSGRGEGKGGEKKGRRWRKKDRGSRDSGWFSD